MVYLCGMRRRFLTGLIAFAVLGVGPALAQRGGAHDRARRAYESGQVQSLGDILTGIRGQVPGRMMDAELKERRGRPTYRLKMLDTKGHVRDGGVDGKSGRVLGRRKLRK